MLESKPSEVKIIEVGPRDGLQNEKTIVTTSDKLKYIQMLFDAGVSELEVTSFVRAPKIPQMSDAVELMALLKKENLKDRKVISLVPNLKGLEEAIQSKVDHIAVFTATSNTFNQKNINATIEESLKRIDEVAKIARSKNIKMRGYISTAFGCPYEGKTSIKEFINIANSLKKFGVYEISIGDTIGVANPSQVAHFLDVVLDEFDSDFLAMHFHDTKGLAIANILTALEFGLTKFDSSSGGLGGCPYAKGASGNVATEDLVHFFESMGINTGINLEKLVKASQFILQKVGKQSTSKVYNYYKEQYGSKL